MAKVKKAKLAAGDRCPECQHGRLFDDAGTLRCPVCDHTPGLKPAKEKPVPDELLAPRAPVGPRRTRRP